MPDERCRFSIEEQREYMSGGERKERKELKQAARWEQF